MSKKHNEKGKRIYASVILSYTRSVRPAQRAARRLPSTAQTKNSRDRTTVREALLGGFVCPMAHVAVALRAILGEFLPLASVLCLWARNLVGLLQPGLTAGRHHDNPSLDPG